LTFASITRFTGTSTFIPFPSFSFRRRD